MKNQKQNLFCPNGTAKERNHCIAFVAGKSGGHIVPALTIAQRYKQENPTSKVIFFSTDTQLDKNIIGTSDVVDTHRMLSLGNFSKNPFKLAKFSIDFFRSLITSFNKLRHARPHTIISTGGYIAIPVCLAAWTLRIPIELYALDAVPGKAAKFLAPFTTRINVCFSSCAPYFNNKCQLTDYPIRFSGAVAAKQTTDKKTILILGGSQGSASINRLIKTWIETTPDLGKKIAIIHQTGAADSAFDWSGFYQKHGITARAFAYENDISSLYEAADIVISRAGAGSLFETAFFKKKCLVIPLEAQTTAHQVDNAYAIAHQYPELFRVIRQKELELHPERLSELF